MKRDFSEEAYNKLQSLVKEVEDEQWCSVTDGIGDFWLGVESWFGALNIQKYVDDIDRYHKKVIDKEDMSSKTIDNIFKNVNNVSTNYKSRFLALLSILEEYKATVTACSNTVDPTKGLFNSEYIGNNLNPYVSEYLRASEYLKMISEDGLTEKDIDVKNYEDANALQRALDIMGNTLINYIPNVSCEGEYEIPIGPDLSFYYKVEAEYDNGSNVSIKTVIDEQRVKITNVGIETDGKLKIGTEISRDGNGKITIKSDRSSASFDISGKLSGSGSYRIGNDTYTVTISGDMSEIKFEESIKTEIEGGSVTTTIGIKKRNNNDTGWMPVPAYVPVEAPYPGVIPSFDINWEAVETIVVVATGVYVLVYIGAAIYTGGTSLVFMPVPV